VKDVGILQNGHDYTSLLGLTEHGNYFNAGVLVFNTSRIRNNIPREKMLRMAVSQRWEYADQCMLNVLCENQVNFLPFSWNVMTGARCNNLPGGLAREYGLSQKRPNIIHYVWDKPWQQFYITPRTRPFWEYASQTPFATEIYSRLVESNLATADITSETMRDMFVRYNRRKMDVDNKSLRQWVKRRLLPET
jgi:lipopolysaccharide biosynthesis glycosyltransferase